MSAGRSPGRALTTVAALGCVLGSAGGAGCAPRARALAGAPAPAAARLPRLEVPAAPQRLVFRWRYDESGFSARGDGTARVAPPDSARLDFFLEGGYGGGWAVLIGDDVRTPPGSVGQRLIPPAPMLWATLGRLAVSAARDTTIRIGGDTLRADVASASGRVWRVTVVAGRLTELEHLERGRVVERVTRDTAGVRFADLVGRRSLAIDLVRREPVDAFPRTIWTR